MKRIKIILAAITTIGIIGGALAFKAKILGATSYCYTTTTAAGAGCCLAINNATALPGAPSIKYVTIFVAADCALCPPCPKLAATFGS